MPSSSNDKTRKTTKKAARSGDPSRRAAAAEPQVDEKYAPTTWGSAAGSAGAPTDLHMPSGQLALVRRPGVEGLLKAGVVNDLDALTAIVGKEHIDPQLPPSQRGPKVDVKQLMDDPKTIEKILHTVDRVVSFCVIQPPIEMTPNDATRRKPGKIYCDMVDLEDRMFILNYAVGGSSDLESFRSELTEAVGDVEPLEDAEGASQ